MMRKKVWERIEAAIGYGENKKKIFYCIFVEKDFFEYKLIFNVRDGPHCKIFFCFNEHETMTQNL